MNRGVVHAGAASVPNGITVRSEPGIWREATDYRKPAQRHTTRWVLERRWAGPGLILGAMFTVLWNAGNVVACAAVLARGPEGVVRAFPVPWIHLLVGLALANVCVAQAFNTTTVDVDGTDVSVAHGPVWWPGGGAVAQAAVERVSAERSYNVNASHRYRVELHSGAAHRALNIGGALRRAEAEYIADALSAQLQLSA